MIIPKGNKKQKKNEKKVNLLTQFVLLGFLILVLFVFLQPKADLSSFITTVENEQSINSQKFWEFREFYSSGQFEFSKDGLTKDKITKLDLPIQLGKNDRIILEYNSPKIYSLDILSEQNSLKPYIASLSAKEFILKKDNEIIFEKDNQTFVLFFKNLSEMKKANGFFDYTNEDKVLVENKNWINLTIIKK